MIYRLLLLVVAVLTAPAAAVPPPPPPNLYHFTIGGIGFECVRKPEETRVRGCRILASESYVDVQILRLSNDGTYYYFATRVCTIDREGNPDWRKRTGTVHAGKLLSSGLPQAIAELEAMPLSPACHPPLPSAAATTSYAERLDIALVILDNLWRE